MNVEGCVGYGSTRAGARDCGRERKFKKALDVGSIKHIRAQVAGIACGGVPTAEGLFAWVLLLPMSVPRYLDARLLLVL